jgi:hypothetical protein
MQRNLFSRLWHMPHPVIQKYVWINATLLLILWLGTLYCYLPIAQTRIAFHQFNQKNMQLVSAVVRKRADSNDVKAEDKNNETLKNNILSSNIESFKRSQKKSESDKSDLKSSNLKLSDLKPSKIVTENVSVVVDDQGKLHQSIYIFANHVGLRINQIKFSEPHSLPATSIMPAMMTFDIEIPLKGRYSEIKQWLALLLIQFPSLTLQELHIANEKNNESMVDCSIHLRYFLLKDAS